MAIVLKCPECKQKFRWDFDAEDRWPKACPLCGAVMDDGRNDDVICMPALKSPQTDSVDKTYRQIEAASEHRMEQAAQLAGTTPAEMSALKITDLKTGVKPGESYMPEVSNTVTQTMDQIRQRGGQIGFTGTDGAGYSGAVQTGPLPNAGAKMRTVLQQQHALATHGNAVSERPALETLQPGYRRRG